MRGLYIHIPFCVKKCKYCDFVSFEGGDCFKDRYIESLINEMKEYSGALCDTVFIGGGTPTTLKTYQLEKLLAAVKDIFNISSDAEITCEANPGTVDAEKLTAMKKGGVNRLSIGVQTFCDEELKAIGRIHNAEEAEKAIDDARACGFENISIDIISALPGQTVESFKKTLSRTVLKKPEHISCYSLILEENTPLYEEYKSGRLILPDEDSEREMYDWACDFLKKNGYNQYEISNFAMPGKESKHNIKYWQCKEYIGVGVAAHSYYNGMRYFNTDNLREYSDGKYRTDEKEALSLKDKIEEFMIMGLRMTDGICEAEFKRRFGMEAEELFGNVIKKFTDGGFMEKKDGFIRLTHKGTAVSNTIMCEFTDFNIKK